MANGTQNDFSLKPEEIIPKVRSFDGHDWFSTQISRRNLPHWELKGSTYFITIRVDSSVGNPFLKKEIANYMQSMICQQDKKSYLLYAYVIMPDHLHMLIKPLAGHALKDIMQKLKGGSSYYLNKLLGRSGQFWQKESFDHIVRDDFYMREKWNYIKENPVKARLVKNAGEYPYSSFYEENGFF